MGSDNGKVAREIFVFNAGGRERRADPGKIDLDWRREMMLIDEQSLFDRFGGPPWLEDYDRMDDAAFKAAHPAIDDTAVRMALNARDTATMELLPIIYRVYGLEPYTFNADTGEERGVTAGEMFNIRSDFLKWQSGVKKNTEPEPASGTPILEVSPS